MENWNERKLKWEHWCSPMRAWSSAALLWLKAVSGLFSLQSWVRGCYAAGCAKSEPKLPVSSTSPCLTPCCYLSHFSPGKQNSSITLGITSYSELLISGMWIWDTSWNYFCTKVYVVWEECLWKWREQDKCCLLMLTFAEGRFPSGDEAGASSLFAAVLLCSSGLWLLQVLLRWTHMY